MENSGTSTRTACPTRTTWPAGWWRWRTRPTWRGARPRTSGATTPSPARFPRRRGAAAAWRAGGWGYGAVTGALSAAQERGGGVYGFGYDRLGRMTSVHMPGGVVDSTRYDVESRPIWRQEVGPSGPLHEQTSMQYDARGKLLYVNDR